MIGSNDDINAVNEKQKTYLNMIYPQIMADPETSKVSKKIFSRLVHKVNGLQSNIINGFVEYDPSELKAMEYIGMINMDYMPKSLFKEPNLDYYTLWLYIQKAEDGEIKDKILSVLTEMLISLGIDGKQQQQVDNSMSNSAANIMMSQ